MGISKLTYPSILKSSIFESFNLILAMLELPKVHRRSKPCGVFLSSNKEREDKEGLVVDVGRDYCYGG